MLAKMIDSMQPDAVVPVSVRIARARIAACMLGDEQAQLRIGDISLHPHQRSAVTRIQCTLSSHGGALLCDDVGLGKTYAALAVAATHDSVTIVAPATLAPMWSQAAALAHVSIEFISLESLGRGGATERKRTLIIVDEAHHFRNPCTRRYAALARMCMIAPVLLLTATPVHNVRDDLCAIVALFVGSRAYSLSDEELAAMIIRRDAAGQLGVQDVPVVEHVPPHVVITDERVLDMILALPPPVPPREGCVATRLVIHGLARQWASSNAALAGALKRRIARSHGLLASLDAGRYPTANELSAWVYAGDSVQLAFAELLVPAVTPLVALASALREHVAALETLLSFTRPLGDDPLARFVREIRANHPGEKIMAFSCYAETADAVYRALRRDGHVALLTARGAMIASGPISRRDLLEQYAPVGSHALAHPPNDHGDVDFLVATDLLSEGVNLQRASVLIHLDLPWTAARVEQRIGRLARLGSRHSRVVSYSVSPPPRAEAFLHETELVTYKSDLSARILGGSRIVSFSEVAPRQSALLCGEQVRRIMEVWRTTAPDSYHDQEGPAVAATAAPGAGMLGAWIVDGVPTLLACNASMEIDANPVAIRSATTLADQATDTGTARAVIAAEGAVAVQAAETWYDQRCAWLAVGGNGLSAARVTTDARRILARVADATSANAGFARRARSASVSSRLRSAAAIPLPLAIEWSLESLAEYADDASVNTILDLVDRARPEAGRVTEKGIRCVALILFHHPADAGP
jgi:helicase-like protein